MVREDNCPLYGGDLENFKKRTQFWGRLLVCWLSSFATSFAQAPPPKSSLPKSQIAHPVREKAMMKLERSPYGQTPDDAAVELFKLTNSAGNSVMLTNYGAIIVSVAVPDREGRIENVNLGFDSLDGYLGRHPYFGATVGRFCNRIAGGKFTLEGVTYTLAVNNGPNHLHGGVVGFDKLIWAAEEIQKDSLVGVRFAVLSPDGQEGYPGNLQVEAEYTWSEANELAYTFRATTDKPTVLNLTNHAYWNLAGAGQGQVLGHQLQLMCERYLAVDDTLIPTGELLSVENTPLDFRQPREIGERIAVLPATKGYDHCFVVNGHDGELRTCGIVKHPGSGRVMEVLTTQPGVQLYTGNHLGGEFLQYGGFCLETQHYPDSPNRPEFPSTRLNPGQAFEMTTVHRFSIE
jgi:aldose 1-epimerase